MSDIVERITAYLSLGGLFNPELADHDAVRDMIIDCRGEITALRAEVERLRVERDEQVQWVKDLADDLIKAEAENERLRAEVDEYATKIVDLVADRERLRAALETHQQGSNLFWRGYAEQMNEEQMALHAENERLRAALKEIADKPLPHMHAVYMARAALGGTDDTR